MLKRSRPRPGKRRKTAVRPAAIRNSESPKVSVIIPARNERRSIAAVIRQAWRVHPETEVIVVANGSTDGTAELAQRIGARVIRFPYPLGHDVGRGVGAAEARGDILLFTDADIVIPTRDLQPLTKAVEQGVDVALNKYLGPTDKHHVHEVVLAKQSLNIIAASPELRSASLTTIPHAISRHARDVIGSANLAVPPKAQAIALYRELNVRCVHYVEVGRTNRRRGRKTSESVGDLILGDHLEAIDWLTAQCGSRANRPDLARRRECVGDD